MILVLVRIFRRLRAKRSLGLGLVLMVLVTSILGNSLCYYYFDKTMKPDLTMEDALWYSIISMTTIGYGDHSASSTGARLGTIIFVVLVGLSSFTAFLGIMIDSVTNFILRGQQGMRTVMASNHVLIVNFPSEARVKQLIEEIRSDPHRKGVEIVVVTNQIDRLPSSLQNVLFVQGSPLEADTYECAQLRDAKMVIVLAPSYSDSHSDAVVASTISVIDSIKSEAHIVAECIDEKHKMLFKSVHCDAIVFGLKITGNLLVQELNDPGVTQTIDVITSNLVGATLYSTKVTDGTSLSYRQIAKEFVDHDINLISVNRGNDTFTTFHSVQPQAGDTVVYVAAKRLPWSQLLSFVKP